MGTREINRVLIFERIKEKRLTQTKAAELLNLSLRQVRRLYAEFKIQGAKALISGKRGKSSNNRLADILRIRILELVTCELYAGFRPTFMCEKLAQYHDIKVSVETVRQLMIESEVWKPKQKKRPVIHQQRLRRARCGELVQVDGSPHAWFEDRAKPCTLIVFIDDATGHTYGKFFEAETSQAYMEVTQDYIEKHGKMVAIYSDRHNIFRVNIPGCVQKTSLTQYGRALKELDIELICANSPQAKGRVERANQTLQDRLVKELRLAEISTMEAANEFLLTYWKEHNKRFSCAPRDKRDAHRALREEEHLERIFCHKEYRKVSKNLEIQYNSVIYQLEGAHVFRGAQVRVLERFNGEVEIEHKGQAIGFREFYKQEYQGEIVTSKEVERFLRGKHARKVSKDHPWKQEGRKKLALAH
jgi:hypothetical protein